MFLESDDSLGIINSGQRKGFTKLRRGRFLFGGIVSRAAARLVIKQRLGQWFTSAIYIAVFYYLIYFASMK